MEIIDGKKIAEKMLLEVKEKVSRLKNKDSLSLDIILVGDDFASSKYVEMKARKAEELGINNRIHRLSENCPQHEVLTLIDELNENTSVMGLMIQLPLPKTLDKNAIINRINPMKDVDGLTGVNLGLLFQGSSDAIAPATPLGIMKIFEACNIDLLGKDVVIIGSSTLVGLPLEAMLINKGATVTLTHKDTKDLQRHSSNADILVSVVGRLGLVTRSHVKPGAIVIDVGTSKHPVSGKIVGDVDFDNVAPLCSYITPVPGGVGPVTIASLFSNLITIAERQ